MNPSGSVDNALVVNPQTLLRYILGYLVGFGIFLAGIPSGLCFIAKQADRVYFVTLISDERTRITLASVIGLVGGVLVVRSNLWLLCRLRQWNRECLNEEMAHTVASPTKVDEELRHLFRVLARG